jgi:UDP-galactopyranose mutase
VNEKEILHKYVERAKASHGVTFLGRLGTYRYLDMDATILEALQAADRALSLIKDNEVIPSFFTNPLDA